MRQMFLRVAISRRQCLAGLGLVLSVPAIAQTIDYPNKPLRLIVSVPPGGSVDIMARIVAEKLRHKWGQPVVVENRPGAGNLIGMDAVIRSAPDGYTLLFGPGGSVLVQKLLNPNRTPDPESLEPVSQIAINPLALVIHPQVRARNLADFVAYAKANPGALNYASAGDGSTPHLTAELFQHKVGVVFAKVPYRGVAPAMTDLLAGQVDMIFVDISTAIEHIRSKRLLALGVAAERRNAALPDVPIFPDLYPGLVSETWFAVYAPPNTPVHLRETISAAIAQAIKEPDVQRRMHDMGGIEAVGSSPTGMAHFMERERARWATVIKEANVKGD